MGRRWPWFCRARSVNSFLMPNVDLGIGPLGFAGPPPRELSEGQCLSSTNAGSNTDLLRAATLWDASTVEQLLAAGVDPNCSDAEERTPLMVAAAHSREPEREHGCVRVASPLLDAGADVNRRDRNGNTALIVAALTGHDRLVDLLLANGADPNLRNELTDSGCAGGYAALHYAARNGRTTIVAALLRCGAQVNLPRASDDLPLRPIDLMLRRAPVRNREKVLALLTAAGGEPTPPEASAGMRRWYDPVSGPARWPSGPRD